MPTRFFAFLWLLLASCIAHAAEPIDPEQAFRFSARALDARTIEARWDITPEYYLYKEKIEFTVEPASVRLGIPDLPKGKEKEDEFFGKVHIYRGSAVARIPVEAGSGALVLKATSQGCWDGGVCYPPLTQEARITLAGTDAVPPAPTFDMKQTGTPPASMPDAVATVAASAARHPAPYPPPAATSPATSPNAAAAASGSRSSPSSASACCSRSHPASSR
jgi:thiol:disulfide interchange protein DsbD